MGPFHSSQRTPATLSFDLYYKKGTFDGQGRRVLIGFEFKNWEPAVDKGPGSEPHIIGRSSLASCVIFLRTQFVFLSSS